MKISSEISIQDRNRRKWLASLLILAVVPFGKIFRRFGKDKKVISCAPPKEKKIVKLLAQNGKLVEVDLTDIKILNSKVTDQELQKWIKR
jgi:hypothetical protein